VVSIHSSMVFTAREHLKLESTPSHVQRPPLPSYLLIPTPYRQRPRMGGRLHPDCLRSRAGWNVQERPTRLPKVT